VSKRNSNVISRPNAPITPLHAAIVSPKSRAVFAEERKLINGNLQYGIESGKFFPETTGGLKDVFARDDVTNIPPPADGKIASGEQPGAAYLDRLDIDWDKHQVIGGELFDFTWKWSAPHKYRRFNYFITRADWNPSLPLSRAQFEPTPFYSVLNEHQPYWSYNDEMYAPNPSTHTFVLPEREGYHVLLGVWEVAETDKAFYQVVDLDFQPQDGGGKPHKPTGLTLTHVAHNSVSLKWDASSDLSPADQYIIKRDGNAISTVPASQTTFTDNSVSELTDYVYTVIAAKEGSQSLPSIPVTVKTPSRDGKPSAPANLHSMGETPTAISLMWGESVGSSPIRWYYITRDGKDIQAVPGNLTSYVDDGLTPDTEYSYSVRAEDLTGNTSPDSNVLTKRTKPEGGGQYRPWVLGEFYQANEKVSHNGKDWLALVSHTAHVESWAPGASDGFTLWKEITESWRR